MYNAAGDPTIYECGAWMGNPDVELDVTPEPSPEEREAIAAALADEPQQDESPWWRAGLPGAEDER